MEEFKRLRFRSVEASTWDDDFPPSELLSQGPNSRGWLSARGCDYPQEILIEFENPVKVHQLEFLSH